MRRPMNSSEVCCIDLSTSRYWSYSSKQRRRCLHVWLLSRAVIYFHLCFAVLPCLTLLLSCFMDLQVCNEVLIDYWLGSVTWDLKALNISSSQWKRKKTEQGKNKKDNKSKIDICLWRNSRFCCFGALRRTNKACTSARSRLNLPAEAVIRWQALAGDNVSFGGFTKQNSQELMVKDV